MAIEAKIIADSISPNGKRLTTLQLKYPRFIHAEFMTHRVFSRNASSSRAIPVAKMLHQVWNDPAMPVHWGANQAGMQAESELSGIKRWLAEKAWRIAGKSACVFAWALNRIKLHKQIANRILEPWQYIHVVVTATEWDNFFELRAHPDAQPEIQALAVAMQEATGASTPTLLQPGEWHLPYVSAEDQSRIGNLDLCKKVSAARCCRVSYLKHDGTRADIAEDLLLCDRLVGARPLHASPFEHQGTPDDLKFGLTYKSPHLHGNLQGWIQFRKQIEL